MRIRLAAAVILALGGLAILLSRAGQPPTISAPGESVPKANQGGNKSDDNAENQSLRPISATVDNSDDSLTSAKEMAGFISQIIATVPSERTATRDHLSGIQALFFISDYVLAARTNSSLILSEPAITSALATVSPDTSLLKERLRVWAVRPGSLADHYQSISQHPTEKQNVAAIKAAMTACGLAVDLEGDLLMDCIRYVVHKMGAHEMYGPNPRRLNEATPFPAELSSLLETGDKVFHHRFVLKHRLDEQTAKTLMNRIKNLRIYDLAPADVEIPVTRFE